MDEQKPLYVLETRYKVIYHDTVETSKVRIVYLTLKYIEEMLLHFIFDDGEPMVLNKRNIITIKPAPKRGVNR